MGAPSKRKEKPQESKCAIVGCKSMATTNEYCRLHYIVHWNKIKRLEQAEAEKRLNRYIEEITRKYPTEYLEVIKRDLEDSKALENIVGEMEMEFGMENGEELLDNEDEEKIYEGFKLDDEDKF